MMRFIDVFVYLLLMIDILSFTWVEVRKRGEDGI